MLSDGLLSRCCSEIWLKFKNLLFLKCSYLQFLSFCLFHLLTHSNCRWRICEVTEHENTHCIKQCMACLFKLLTGDTDMNHTWITIPCSIKLNTHFYVYLIPWSQIAQSVLWCAEQPEVQHIWHCIQFADILVITNTLETNLTKKFRKYTHISSILVISLLHYKKNYVSFYFSKTGNLLFLFFLCVKCKVSINFNHKFSS